MTNKVLTGEHSVTVDGETINMKDGFVGVDLADDVGKTVFHVTDLEKTESSNVSVVAFDDNSNTAFVSFKNGSLYKYDNVDRNDFENLRDAESVGRHLSKVFLKKGFEYEKLENTKLNLLGNDDK